MGPMTDARSTVRRAGRAGRDADGSDWLDAAVRAGLVAYGVVHLLIAWLALQIALGQSDNQASSTGALREVDQQPLGGVLIWLIAAGFFLLVLWRVVQVVQGDPDKDGASDVVKRAQWAGKGVVYAVIGVSAVRIAVGSGGGSGGGGGTDSTTAKLMREPFGPWLVGAVGVAILAVGGYLVVKAWTDGFRTKLDAEGQSGDSGRVYLWWGRAGYTAKGVAYAVVGGLFVWAAVAHDPRKSGGLDQALHEVARAPFGRVLLVLIALGIACYGLFAFARARHLRR